MKGLKTISLALCGLMAFGALSGCSKEEKTEEVDLTATQTEEYLIKDFKSDYSVLIPNDATSIIRTAATELHDFLYEASGYDMKIVNDASASSGKLISLGETTMQQQSGVTATFEEYGDSGYKMQTTEKGIVIIGGSDTATLYGVYKFLQYHVDFKAYSTDYVTYKTSTTVPLWAFDGYSFKPDMPIINVSGKETSDLSKIVNCARMGQISSNWMGYTFEGMFFGGGLNAHSAFKLVSTDNFKDHPEWFTATGTNGERKAENLCLTNEDMRQEYVKNLKVIIANNPGSAYYMLGNEDNRSVCECADCAEAGRLYGGPSGVYVRFLNKVSDDIDAWLAEEHPERVGHVFLCGLGYFGFVEPPVVEDENGNYVLADESVKLKSNCYIQYCTHDGCQSHAIDDPNCSTNATMNRQLRGWSVAADNLMIYQYTHCYTDYYLYFNNWGPMQENMKYFKDIGVKYFFVQSNAAPNGVACEPLLELKHYVYVELAKNVNANYNELVNDFISNYYGVASSFVQRFYTDLRNHFAVMEQLNDQEKKDKGCWGIYTYMFNDWREKKYWDYNWLQSEMALLSEAIAETQKAGYDEAEAYRIEDALLEMLIPMQYRTIQYYSAYFTTEGLAAAKAEYLANCEKANVSSRSMFSYPMDEY